MPQRLLNVEGYITTIPKAHQIKLSQAEKFGPEFVGLGRPVTSATVLIKDDLGSVENLVEVGSGYYATSPDFAAVVGRSYNLEIYLLDGSRYVSLSETAMPVPEVDSVTYHSVRTVTTDRLNDEIGVRVMAHFQDPPDVENYYFWNVLESDFVLITEPELYLLPFDHPTNPRGPAPKDCCAKCFHKDKPKPTNIITVSDVDFDGIYQNRRIAYVRDDGLRFKETYRLDIQHLSVSAETYRFLKLIDQQLSLTGSVFDPPPANIRGNIISLNDRDEQALGHFFVSDERFLRVYIIRDQLEFYLSPQTTVPDDCREFLQQANFPMPFLPVDPPADWDTGN
ncbi:DUF4249 domain-containing protein [Aquiflexum lacus]|uniref:DUF4249 domain-containing protein n=1 Tax=Aquiflexum lacus TaxID=2483805 RepID=UPI00293B9E17|nr:DUF4249 domain-containing protein [Aquiflexum lacus]